MTFECDGIATETENTIWWNARYMQNNAVENGAFRNCSIDFEMVRNGSSRKLFEIRVHCGWKAISTPLFDNNGQQPRIRTGSTVESNLARSQQHDPISSPNRFPSSDVDSTYGRTDSPQTINRYMHFLMIYIASRVYIRSAGNRTQ